MADQLDPVQCATPHVYRDGDWWRCRHCTWSSPATLEAAASATSAAAAGQPITVVMPS